ncbi:MAG: alpha/beta hydrolase [Gammaproteobacteria bacterium]
MLFEFRAERIKTSGAELFIRHRGEGKPLVLLHGFPQTGAMWHRVAPALSERYRVICPDLRGYGRSDKPLSNDSHSPYSKQAMARDVVEIMRALGHERFMVAGHDRGARVAHRLALDYPESIERLCVMDIVPTLHMFDHTDQSFATGYYHWFFLIQGNGLPERMIGADPDYYLRSKLAQWSAPEAIFAPEALEEYLACFRQPETIHATCEDYRAAASIDLVHDRRDRHKRVTAPLLALWGNKGFVHRTYDVVNVWRDYANDVSGEALPCGHFLAEESPSEVLRSLSAFLSA